MRFLRLALVLAVAPVAEAQLARPMGMTLPLDSAPALRLEEMPTAMPRSARPQWWAPIASAAVPGTGQAVLNQKRWLPYLALEVWAWIQYADTRRTANRRRDEYQRIAREVARSRFPGPYPVGGFDYYEHMLKNAESGDFDRIPGGVIDPETDTATFNGRRWLDARRLYWEDPSAPPPVGSEAYENALKFYEDNAIGTDFRWSWRTAQFEYDLFRRTIVRSNASYRRSVEYLGVIIANHALSAVDAFVTLRIRTRADAPGVLEFDAQLPMASILPRH